ncbi:SAM-dependent methyltransferase [Niveispirillum sp. KHB5.9]|uniref:SAM-dependent methyltransferase n=1 Tax=Niveispirillum sp. KHB5.9 TaxID=3400269 RepID=UPI003A8B4448
MADTTGAYDEDYFERGVVVGKSGYMNYRWMPEMTIRMAHFMIRNLDLKSGQRVLDFGCAKGFLVKALRLLDIDAEGIDVSEYAISMVDTELRGHCRLVRDVDDDRCFVGRYEMMIAKDVFEHLTEAQVRTLLAQAKGRCARVFAAIPLAADNHSGSFIVPEYNKDITHITAKTFDWWRDLFIDCGWTIEEGSYTCHGIKENWTRYWPDGNGFFTLKAR